MERLRFALAPSFPGLDCLWSNTACAFLTLIMQRMAEVFGMTVHQVRNDMLRTKEIEEVEDVVENFLSSIPSQLFAMRQGDSLAAPSPVVHCYHLFSPLVLLAHGTCILVPSRVWGDGTVAATSAPFCLLLVPASQICYSSLAPQWVF